MNHKDLEVWKKSMELVIDIYKITQKFPDTEKFGLINQIRRAVVSVPSNIAEGCARNSDKDNLRFVDIACGSLAEIETQLLISVQLGYYEMNKALLVIDKIDNIGRMLSGLKKHLRNKV